VPILTTNLLGGILTNLLGTIGFIWNTLPAPTTNDLQGRSLMAACIWWPAGTARCTRA